MGQGLSRTERGLTTTGSRATGLRLGRKDSQVGLDPVAPIRPRDRMSSSLFLCFHNLICLCELQVIYKYLNDHKGSKGMSIQLGYSNRNRLPEIRPPLCTLKVKFR